ncbi:MAG: response regulator [Candidatus Sulfobium sp.]|jgi:CheY-like chemotaxis protein
MSNILVVDDDCLVRIILREVLRLNNHNVREASNGQEALDMIDPNALPDLIFMDYLMPGHSGIDCAKQLKALYPSLKIVIISGYCGIDDDGYLIANKHLFADIILKPFQIKYVVTTVEHALGISGQSKGRLVGCDNTTHPA